MKCFVPAIVLLTSGVAGAQTWTLLDATLEPRRVELVSIDKSGVVVEGESGRSTISIDDVARLTQVADFSASPITADLMLAGGFRIAGAPGGLEGNRLIWASPTLGETAVPIEHVRAIVFASDVRLPPASPQDVLLLANGDRMTGIVLEADEAGLKVDSETAGEVRLDWPAVLAWQLADVGASSPWRPAFRVELSDGSALPAEAVSLDGESAGVRLFGVESAIESGKVRRIENLRGRARFLDDGSTESRFTPYFGQTQVEPATPLEKIRVRGERVERGIVTRPRTVLSFDAGGKDVRLRTQFAVPDERRLADVTVRVKADGRVVFEAKNVRAGAVNPVVDLKIEKAGVIQLETDYGELFDVDDELVWIDPVVVR